MYDVARGITWWRKRVKTRGECSPWLEPGLQAARTALLSASTATASMSLVLRRPPQIGTCTPPALSFRNTVLACTSRIDIPVMQRPAVWAFPFSDGQRQFGDFEATARARLRCGGPVVQSYEMLSGPLRLIGDFGLEAIPPDIPDRLRKAAVLLHSLDLRRLDDDRLVFVNQSSSQVVLEIASAVGDAFMRRGDKASGPVRSFLLAREGFLLARQLSLDARVT
jgi:hypothetical protein